MESNADLKLALDELAKILEAKQRKRGVGDSVLEEIALLEEDIAVRSERLRELVKQIQSG